MASAAADSRPEKRARLQSFRDRVPYVSQSAFAKILRLGRQEELPEASSRRDVRVARDTTVMQETPYGPIHRQINIPGTTTDVKLEIQDPFAMLWHCSCKSECFARLIEQTCQRHPNSPARPWNIVFYTDEVGPGNQLAYRNRRKFHACYWTVLEFGSAALSNEEAWFELAVCRNDLAKEMRGGTSGMVRALM